jgi:arabinose-5-phosphate isomerase
LWYVLNYYFYLDTKVEKNIIAIAKKVLTDETEAIKSLLNTIDETFVSIVKKILSSKGKIVISGIGKSGFIAQKIVATLNSTGQKAAFLHAADALHGDLGLIDEEDIIIIISKSGNTPEIKVLTPLIKRAGNTLIALVSDTKSYLALQADHVLNAHVEREACPLNLAPTSSTTAALALGDALAIALLESRNFGSKDFAKYHPGGTLGKKLYLKVQDLSKLHGLPTVNLNASFQEAILEMTSKRLGAVAVIDEQNTLKGIITDGDLRRFLNKNIEIKNIKAADIMNPKPKTIAHDAYASEALMYMQNYAISQLVVMKESKLEGFIHIHDLLKEGLI